MTGRLLPAFLDCLKSDYISIRLEAVMVSDSLNDPSVEPFVTLFLPRYFASEFNVFKAIFLGCLYSNVFIRSFLFQTVSAIRLAHEETVTELLKLATEERNWKVKAHCIKGILAPLNNPFRVD